MIDELGNSILFEDFLWPTLVGGLMILGVILIIYAGLTLVEAGLNLSDQHNVNWKKIIRLAWIVLAILGCSWFIGIKLLGSSYG